MAERHVFMSQGDHNGTTNSLGGWCAEDVEEAEEDKEATIVGSPVICATNVLSRFGHKGLRTLLLSY